MRWSKYWLGYRAALQTSSRSLAGEQDASGLTEAQTGDIIYAETDGNTAAITLTVWSTARPRSRRPAGYDDARHTHTLDLMFDAYLSDIDSITVLFGQDGTKVDLYA